MRRFQPRSENPERGSLLLLLLLRAHGLPTTAGCSARGGNYAADIDGERHLNRFLHKLPNATTRPRRVNTGRRLAPRLLYQLLDGTPKNPVSATRTALLSLER
ncbi:unnamed protein product [Lampetra fluviatilis]